MSDAKHIPGPWRADEHQMVWGKTKRGDIMICQIRGWGHLTGAGGLRLPDEQAAAVQDANLRLCAAAPDLLEACYLAQEALLQGGHSITGLMHSALDRLKAAIDKATGEPK